MRFTIKDTIEEDYGTPTNEEFDPPNDLSTLEGLAERIIHYSHARKYKEESDLKNLFIEQVNRAIIIRSKRIDKLETYIISTAINLDNTKKLIEKFCKKWDIVLKQGSEKDPGENIDYNSLIDETLSDHDLDDQKDCDEAFDNYGISDEMIKGYVLAYGTSFNEELSKKHMENYAILDTEIYDFSEKITENYAHNEKTKSYALGEETTEKDELSDETTNRNLIRNDAVINETKNLESGDEIYENSDFSGEKANRNSLYEETAKNDAVSNGTTKRRPRVEKIINLNLFKRRTTADKREDDSVAELQEPLDERKTYVRNFLQSKRNYDMQQSNLQEEDLKN